MESRHIYPDATALARGAAEALLEAAQIGVSRHGLFTVALAGGSTPKKLYALLATDPAFAAFPWASTHFFFGDERHVAPRHPESNFFMVEQTLLSTDLVPKENVHRIHAELPDARQAAADYEVELRSFFSEPQRHGGFPRFDVILLGMGPDGHTASLFPDTPALNEKARWVVANPVEKLKTDRITLTFPVLDSARAVLLLVAGDDKAEKIGEIFGEKKDTLTYPVQRVQPVQGSKDWLLDQAAAAKLSP